MTAMRLGYACVNTELPTSARTVRLANARTDRLRELIGTNLEALETILRWNRDHDIEVFRVTSNLIPFGSHPVNEIAWWDEFSDRFADLARIVRGADMRLSTHPGQYTVISSARPEVVEASIAELVYHDRLLVALGLDRSHKIVTHVGGTTHGGAGERLLAALERLPAGPRSRLVLENDERWPLADTLELANAAELPVVFDVFHHEIAPSFAGATVREVTQRAAATWADADGRPEVHFSTQDPGKRPGAHAEMLDAEAFASFSAEVGDLPLDCILEVKDKERSVLHAQALLQASPIVHAVGVLRGRS